MDLPLPFPRSRTLRPGALKLECPSAPPGVSDSGGPGGSPRDHTLRNLPPLPSKSGNWDSYETPHHHPLTCAAEIGGLSAIHQDPLHLNHSIYPDVLVPRADVAKDHRLGDLNDRNSFSRLWRLEVQTLGVDGVGPL